MFEEVLEKARRWAADGGMVVIGVAGDVTAIKDIAKKAATAWGSRAVFGDDDTSWYVRVKMGHVVFQPVSSTKEQDFKISL